jgi:hypothetical protein
MCTIEEKSGICYNVKKEQKKNKMILKVKDIGTVTHRSVLC